jgi:formylglycine-generating enzyme required for sulfatase activity
MPDQDRQTQLAQLKTLYEQGMLSEANYQAALKGLGLDPAAVLSQVETEGGAYVEGDVRADTFVGRDYVEQHFVGDGSTDPQALRAAYLSRLMHDCERLPLRGVNVDVADPGRGRQERLGLAQIYVALDTKTQVPEPSLEALAAGEPLPDLGTVQREASGRPRGDNETKRVKRMPLPALGATIANRRLVLLGDPGSGKSTFLNHLTLCLAGLAMLSNETKTPDGEWVARLPGWPQDEHSLTPLPVVLRDFARWLEGRPAEAGTRSTQAGALWDFVQHWLSGAGLEAYSDLLHTDLVKGRAFVLLDGLDEVPNDTLRGQVRDAVADWCKTFDRCRVLVTCRTLSYTDPAWRLPEADFPTFELAPLDEGKIDHFVVAWYNELAHLDVVPTGDAQALAKRLQAAVRRPDLWQLAPNPLLLTVMALVHTHKGRLPEARALLYEECVDLLLWRWEAVKRRDGDGKRGLRKLLLEADLQDVDLKRTLWRIAFDMHCACHADAVDAPDAADLASADVAQADLLGALRGLHPDESWDWAQAVVDQMKERAGLLIERQPGVYAFPHRTFQEYLAGCYLSAQGDFAESAAHWAAQGALWREVILLAVGRLVHHAGDTDKPLALVAELCPDSPPTSDEGWRAAWLAAQVLLETGLKRVRKRKWGRELWKRVRSLVADLVDGGALSPVERADAGRVLARLGDPRPGVGVDSETGLPDFVWCEVPAGPFLMGSEDYSDEKPPHTLTLPAFKMGQYPVTNSQYRPFVEAGGYGERRYWTGEGWARKEKGEWTAPREFGTPFNLDNHPVVGFSWYEVVAYCCWLTEVWRAAGRIGPDQVVRLPSEAEWEKAARGADGRRYPWGDEADPARANYSDTGIGSTSAVGCFPDGVSPYGCLDMAGNVREWTSSLYKDYPYDAADGREDPEAEALRVLRGGAFGSDRDFVRCADRDGGGPNLRLNYVGVRVVVSSIPPAL